MPRTRLAPSPTGALHLGNARTFLITWAIARQRGWEILLRVEDLDGPRVKPAYVDQAIDDLQWLGIDWDLGPVTQRADGAPYRAALEQLHRSQRVYRCTCTRQQMEAAALSAPHGDEHELRYAGTCRPRSETVLSNGPLEIEPGVAYRLRVPEQSLEVCDEFAGTHVIDVASTIGDFLVWTKQDLPSYQLAVVVDDHRQGIDQVIRGDDLLSSAARQAWIYRFLGLTPIPTYTHLPLVRGEDGRRLAKRHGDTRIGQYRSWGVSPDRLRGLLARWSGIACQSISAKEFAAEFRLENLPRQAVTFRSADDHWLRGGNGRA